MKKEHVDRFFDLFEENNIDNVSLECCDYHNTKKNSNKFGVTFIEKIDEFGGMDAGISHQVKNIFKLIFEVEKIFEVHFKCEMFMFSEVMCISESEMADIPDVNGKKHRTYIGQGQSNITEIYYEIE